MDGFQIVYHIDETSSQYLSELVDNNILLKDEATSIRHGYIFNNKKIYVASQVRIITFGKLLDVQAEELRDALSEYFDVRFVSYIGHKRLRDHHVVTTILDAIKKVDPFVKEANGRYVSFDSRFDDSDSDSEDSDENNKFTQCSTSSFGIILSERTLCINGPHIRGINRLYCSLLGVDYDSHIANQHISDINLYDQTDDSITINL